MDWFVVPPSGRSQRLVRNDTSSKPALLETLIRGPYIDFLPGAADGALVAYFQGLDQAPSAARLADGLEILLASTRRGLLRAGN